MGGITVAVLTRQQPNLAARVAIGWIYPLGSIPKVTR
jgi:hypothetical protein